MKVKAVLVALVWSKRAIVESLMFACLPSFVLSSVDSSLAFGVARRASEFAY